MLIVEEEVGVFVVVMLLRTELLLVESLSVVSLGDPKVIRLAGVSLRGVGVDVALCAASLTTGGERMSGVATEDSITGGEEFGIVLVANVIGGEVPEEPLENGIKGIVEEEGIEEED